MYFHTKKFIMDLRNKVLLYFLFKGYVGLIVAAVIKISGNPNADMALAIAMVIKFSAIAGLIVYNFPKIQIFFRR